MSAPAAASYQAIREEAGLQHVKKGETPSGTADGSNKQFVVARTYVVDRNYDNVLGATDVIAYVGGVPAPVDAVAAESGLVTLVGAPGAGVSVRMDYAYSALSDATVAQFLSESTDWLRGAVKSYIDYDNLTAQTFPALFSTAARLYAAGLILIRDYGSSADTDLTSKDGYKKIQLAKSMITDWITETTDDGESLTPATGSMVTDGNVFARNKDLDGVEMSPTPDTDNFFHKDN